MFDGRCIANGIHLRIIQGFRTYTQEDLLHAQGRTVPGPIVTNARGGFSAHNFGYALDAAPDDPTFPAWYPDWNSRDARWQEILSLAKDCGFAEGAAWRTFPDAPHFYLQECPATPTDDMRQAFAVGGMPEVWKIIDELIAKSQGTPDLTDSV